MPSPTLPTEQDPKAKPALPEDPSQGPYSFGADGFLACAFHTFSDRRSTGERLRHFLFPEYLINGKIRTKALEDGSSMNVDWMMNQLHHYGIPFSLDVEPPEKLKVLLMSSVADGLCDAVPPHILEIRATLKAEYKRRMNDYRDKMKVYELNNRVIKFQACATQLEEVMCDASLFVQKYFLHENGDPDRTKTPEPILLQGYTDDALLLTRNTERVPDLHVADGGREGAENVMVIGWSRRRIIMKARAIDTHQKGSGPGFLRLRDDWDRKMEIHREWRNRIQYEAAAKDHKVGSFDAADEDHKASSFHETLLDNRNYIVKCRPIQRAFPYVSNYMHFRIVRRTLAIIDLGIIVGLMILADTPEKVKEIVDTGKWNPDDTDLKDTENDYDDWSDPSDADESEDEDDSEEGKTCHSDNASGEKPDAPTTPPPERPAKRQKMTTPEPPAKIPTGKWPTMRQKLKEHHPRRLYFQWRGYSTETGEIVFDSHNHNTGYLDFLDDEATCLYGSIFTASAMGNVIFHGYGYRGSGEGTLTMDWDAFSHLASERVKVPMYRP